MLDSLDVGGRQVASNIHLRVLGDVGDGFGCTLRINQDTLNRRTPLIADVARSPGKISPSLCKQCELKIEQEIRPVSCGYSRFFVVSWKLQAFDKSKHKKGPQLNSCEPCDYRLF